MAIPDYEKRALAEQPLNGLIIYAEEYAQETWQPIFHIKEIIGEISAYWNLEKDWQRSFNSRLMLSYYDKKAETLSQEERLNTILGLTGYMEELFRTHGQKEIDQIQKIRMLIKEIGFRWKLSEEQMREIDRKAEHMTKETEG